MVCAAIELARGDAVDALERLRAVVQTTELDERPVALSMHVAALLAVTVQRFGPDDRAATLFGFAAGERARRGIALRRAHRPLVEAAEKACRSTLGGPRFDELAAAGAVTAWRDVVANVGSAAFVQRP